MLQQTMAHECIDSSDVAYDIAICGAGPAGTVLALLLAEYWPQARRIALLDGRGEGDHARDSARDPATDTRMIALSHGSRSTLERVGAWRAETATPILQVHVSHRGHFGRTLIDHADYGVEALGYVVRYSHLQQQLDQARQERGLTVLRGARVQAVFAESTVQAEAVRIELASGTSLHARYAVHAEGGLFEQQSSRAMHRDYGQTAVTALVTCALPQTGVAWERFTDEGPIALLPVQHDGRKNYALVWCGSAEDAARRIHQDDAAFLAELHERFGDRLGDFLGVTWRLAYPLGLNAVIEVVNGREYAIGNAAQTLHPVAGQGTNLALRDAATLAFTLREHFDDAKACAQAYARARKRDRAATIRLTDLLPRIFANRLAPLVAARGSALALLDLLPPARDWLARHLMDGQR